MACKFHAAAGPGRCLRRKARRAARASMAAAAVAPVLLCRVQKYPECIQRDQIGQLWAKFAKFAIWHCVLSMYFFKYIKNRTLAKRAINMAQNID
jgi:hypothetical protein